MKVSNVLEMRAMDSSAMVRFGIPEEILMENAGEAVCAVIRNEIGIVGKKFIIFCGLGNNGGDGFVVARKLFSNGAHVRVVILGDGSRYRGAAALNLDIVARLSIPVQEIHSAESIKTALYHSDVVIDAIFGTGLARPVEGMYRDVIQLINGSRRPVVSADIPSGIAGDTGKILGECIRADFTVTFGLPKLGNILFPGYDFCGKQYVTHISFPPALIHDENLKVAISPPILLPKRDSSAHKGSTGQALFIAGAANYLGAPYFSALSFLKAGGGYSRLAAPASITPFIAGRGSEIVFLPQKETEAHTIAFENRDSLLHIAQKMDMVVLGPGLSLNSETQKLIREIAGNVEKPLLIDGDGITAICEVPDLLKKRKGKTVLTPHLGEMSRLTGLEKKTIDENRIEVLQETSARLNAAIVLKGAHSLIGFPDKSVFINLSGNSGMATAGSGDVLAGVIPAMFGLGLNLRDAVVKGVFIHGLAGDLAAADLGEDGITAGDILNYVPLAVKNDREGLDKTLAEKYEGVRVI